MPKVKDPLVRQAADRLRESTKKVIRAFVEQKPGDSRALRSDGRSLWKRSFGESKFAVWRAGRILILNDESSKFDDRVIRYIIRLAGKPTVAFEYDRGGAHPNMKLTFEIVWDDVIGREEYKARLGAVMTDGGERGLVGWVDYSKYQGEYTIDHVHVVPEYRRSGVATALYKELFRREGITVRDLGPSARTDLGQKFRENARLAAARRVAARYLGGSRESG